MSKEIKEKNIIPIFGLVNYNDDFVRDDALAFKESNESKEEKQDHNTILSHILGSGAAYKKIHNLINNNTIAIYNKKVDDRVLILAAAKDRILETIYSLLSKKISSLLKAENKLDKEVLEQLKKRQIDVEFRNNKIIKIDVELDNRKFQSLEKFFSDHITFDEIYNECKKNILGKYLKIENFTCKDQLSFNYDGQQTTIENIFLQIISEYNDALSNKVNSEEIENIFTSCLEKIGLNFDESYELSGDEDEDEIYNIPNIINNCFIPLKEKILSSQQKLVLGFQNYIQTIKEENPNEEHIKEVLSIILDGVLGDALFPIEHRIFVLKEVISNGSFKVDQDQDLKDRVKNILQINDDEFDDNILLKDKIYEYNRKNGADDNLEDHILFFAKQIDIKLSEAYLINLNYNTDSHDLIKANSKIRPQITILSPKIVEYMVNSDDNIKEVNVYKFLEQYKECTEIFFSLIDLKIKQLKDFIQNNNPSIKDVIFEKNKEIPSNKATNLLKSLDFFNTYASRKLYKNLQEFLNKKINDESDILKVKEKINKIIEQSITMVKEFFIQQLESNDEFNLFQDSNKFKNFIKSNQPYQDFLIKLQNVFDDNSFSGYFSGKDAAAFKNIIQKLIKNIPEFMQWVIKNSELRASAESLLNYNVDEIKEFFSKEPITFNQINLKRILNAFRKGDMIKSLNDTYKNLLKNLYENKNDWEALLEKVDHKMGEFRSTFEDSMQNYVSMQREYERNYNKAVVESKELKSSSDCSSTDSDLYRKMLESAVVHLFTAGFNNIREFLDFQEGPESLKRQNSTDEAQDAICPELKSKKEKGLARRCSSLKQLDRGFVSMLNSLKLTSESKSMS